jgi:hypothetical protein
MEHFICIRCAPTAFRGLVVTAAFVIAIGDVECEMLKTGIDTK